LTPSQRKKVFKEYKPPTLRKAKAVEANGEPREVTKWMTQGDQKAKTDFAFWGLEKNDSKSK